MTDTPGPRNLFISYSHQDKEHKAALERHLAPLTRQNLIRVWSDSDILAGENLHDEIALALRECEVFVPLISTSYIQSKYCYEIELTEAMNRRSAETCLVVPIIVRPTAFDGLPISDLKLLPDDAEPIVRFCDSDEGWLQAVRGLQSILEEIPGFRVPHLRTSMSAWLNDTELSYRSRTSTADIKLDALYVFPDLRTNDAEITERTRLAESSHIHAHDSHCLVLAEEQSGKTAFCRRYYAKVLGEGEYYPLYIDAKSISSSKFASIFESALAQQYTISPPLSQCVPLIDDFDSAKLSLEDLSKFTHFIIGNCEKSVVILSETFKITHDFSTLDEFAVFTMLPLGNARREQLIENWLRATGYADGLRESAFLQEHVDEKKRYIDTFVRRNIVPSKAIFILSILQVSVSLALHSLELTSHGHCYQHLILEALRRANTRTENLDSYINYLIELAFGMFESDGRGIERKELRLFNARYSDKFHSPVTPERMVDHLVRCHILNRSDAGQVSFQYRYIYFFYVGKAIADQISLDKTQQTVTSLMGSLHLDDHANIIIFVAHHTRDPSVLEDIQLNLMESYCGVTPAVLTSADLSFLEDLIRDVPRIVFQDRDHRKERLEQAAQADEAERHEEEFGESVAERDSDDVLVRLHHTLRSIDISGQIIRNRVGSLERSKLTDLTVETVNCGLRVLQDILNTGEDFRDEMTEYLEKVIAEHSDMNRSDLEKRARDTVYLLMYGVIYGVIRKLALATGSREVLKIFLEMEEEQGETPAIILLAACVELTYRNSIDMQRLRERYEKLHGNAIPQRLLQEMVVRHLYLYPEDYKIKQKIASSLDIPMKFQNALALKRETKRLQTK